MKLTWIIIVIVLMGALLTMVVYPIQSGVFPLWLNEDYIKLALLVGIIIALLKTLF